jgi:lipoprotein-anchoring transpeptidase ErfK/SrfK
MHSNVLPSPTTGVAMGRWTIPNGARIAGVLSAILMTVATPCETLAAPPNSFARSAGRTTVALNVPTPEQGAAKRPRRAAPSVQNALPAPAVAPRVEEPAPVLAVVSIADQRITVYNGQTEVAQSRVSSGQSGYETPTGLFSIIQKNRYHESNIYSGAPMPFMQRLTWSGIAMHEGPLPGYPASHGCIRLSGSFAQQLWGMTKMGARVVVAPSHVTPRPISHTKLPKPAVTIESVGADSSITPAPGQVASAGPIVATARASVTTPIDAARTLKVKTASVAAEAARRAKIALDISASQSATANEVSARRQAAATAIVALRRQIVDAERAFDLARSPEAADVATMAAIAAEDRIAVLETEIAVAADDEAAVSPIAFEAAAAARDAAALSEKAQLDAQDAARRLEPVSIFVSRKTQMVYVRQGFTQIFEAPVTVLDPDVAIGTHQYIAVAPAADRTDISWIGLTVPETRPAPSGAADQPVLRASSGSSIRSSADGVGLWHQQRDGQRHGLCRTDAVSLDRSTHVRFRHCRRKCAARRQVRAVGSGDGHPHRCHVA